MAERKGGRKPEKKADRRMDAAPATEERAARPAQKGGRAEGGRQSRTAAGARDQQGSKPEGKQPQKPQGKQQGGQPGKQGGLQTQEHAVQPSDQKQPVPPFRPQHQPRPGIEAEVEPRPQYQAPTYRGSGKLDGKVALITGGDSGIGRAVAVLYAREGADVAIVYLPEEQEDAEETRRAVEAEGQSCLLIPGDVTDSQFCEDAVERTLQEFGKLDVLVNNAAFQQHQESLEAITDEQLDRTFRTNIFGYFYMARAALPHLKQGSAIVNCGSITGLQGSKELLDYSATKGAIHAFTKSLAQNLVAQGIRVNCVAPGPIWTPLNVVDKEAEEAAQHGAKVPMKRPGQPEEVAPAFVFFASEADSSYITGEVLTLLGGETTAA